MLVLHIDDDADDREFFIDAVKEVSPKILSLEAKNGVEGYELLLRDQATPIDCIFLDINMPLMDGISLLRLIKDHPRLQRIPVYMYSTTANEQEINYVKRLGAHFLQKSSDFRKLVVSLRQILQPEIIEATDKGQQFTYNFSSYVRTSEIEFQF